MIPVAMTTITVKRIAAASSVDPYDHIASAVPETVASGVRAVISAPSGSERVAGASQEDVTFRLNCDPTDLEHTDQVVDDDTGLTYEVIWAEERSGLGLDHTVADLRRVAGVV